MAKSKVFITEEISKDAQGRTLLNRRVVAKMVNRTYVVYEDVILASDFIKDDSPLSNFQRWAIGLHSAKGLTKKRDESTIEITF